MQAKNIDMGNRDQAAAGRRRVFGSPLVIALGALLALQLLAALALGLGGRDMDPAGNGSPLVSFERDQVTGIRIQSPGGEPVLVAKTESGWVIPALEDLPASALKVTELLSKLEAMEKGLPVATSAPALKRFKVAEDGFERKLTLTGGEGTLATLYLGDSAGFRRLYVRAGGDGSVQEAELGLFDVSDKAADWSDRTLLYLDIEDIRRLTIAGLTLERSDDGWQLTDPADGEEQDTQAVEALVRRLTNLDFLGVLAADDSAAVIQEPPPVVITAVLTSGDRIEYRISKLEEGDDYLLKASNRPQGFRLAAYLAEDLAGIGREDMLKAQEPANDSAAEPTAEPTAEKAAPGASAPPADNPGVGEADTEPAASPAGREPATTEPANPAPEATATQPAAPVPEESEGSRH